MKLTFRVLGYEIARIDLDIEQTDEPEQVTVADKGKKAISRWFFKGMVR